MERLKVEPCIKCGGHAQFYHKVGDVNTGYCKCEACGHQQKKMKPREIAVYEWNKGDVRMKRIWDNFEEVAEVRKSDGIKFVIAAATRDGFRYINIREFYLRKKDNQWMPGRDGITIPLKAPLNKGETFIHPIVDMLDALNKARVAADVMELMDDNKSVWVEGKK